MVTEKYKCIRCDKDSVGFIHEIDPIFYGICDACLTKEEKEQAKSIWKQNLYKRYDIEVNDERESKAGDQD
jgi:hypothetical protein